MYEPNTLNEFKDLLHSIFGGKLLAKTGWGRNEVMRLFEDSLKEAEIEMLKKQLVKQA